MLFCINIAAIEIVNNLVQHDWTKHIEFDCSYIKDNLNFGWIEVSYIKCANQLVNIMTHGIYGVSFPTSLSKLDMCNIYAPT